MEEQSIQPYEIAMVTDTVDPADVDEVIGVLRHLIHSVSSASLKRYLRGVRAEVTRLVEDAELSADSDTPAEAA